MIGYGRNYYRLRFSTLRFLILILALLNPVVSLGQNQNEPQLSEGEDKPILICRTDFVLVHAEVKNEYGMVVSGLRLNEFVIYEDGVLQTIVFFEEEDDSITGKVRYKIGFYPEKSWRKRTSRRIGVEVVESKREGLIVWYRPKRYLLEMK